jgi:hypothetical protein
LRGPPTKTPPTPFSIESPRRVYLAAGAMSPGGGAPCADTT